MGLFSWFWFHSDCVTDVSSYFTDSEMFQFGSELRDSPCPDLNSLTLKRSCSCLPLRCPSLVCSLCHLSATLDGPEVVQLCTQLTWLEPKRRPLGQHLSGSVHQLVSVYRQSLFSLLHITWYYNQDRLKTKTFTFRSSCGLTS